MSKTAILKAGFEAIYRSGAANLMSRCWGGVGAIFCLHHVLPGGGLQQGFAPNANLEITPEFLSELIFRVKSKGYETISISEMAVRLERGAFPKSRFAVFTLDDGYKDNLVHAMPIFKQHQCPFTMFVAPRIAEGTCELWWRILEAVISKNSSVKIGIAGHGHDLETETTQQKCDAWNRLAPSLMAMPEYAQRDWVNRLAENHGIDVKKLCRQAAMTWDDIRLMARDPLATIGAHTLNHYNLKKLSSEDSAREIIDSGRRIGDELQKKIEHFAYPYGNQDAADIREFEFAKKAGYHTAVVTRLGTVLPQHKNHMQALPRIMISGRYQNLNYIEALMSGVPSRLTNKLGGLNVN